MSSLRDQLSCAICTDVLIRPRIYPCGHSFCTPCHVCADEDDRSDPSKMSEFSCPMCRHKTYQRWFERPLNLTLMQVAETMPEYAKRMETFVEPKHEVVTVPETFNLTKIAERKREILAKEAIDFLIPHLLSCAEAGHTRFCVTNRDAKSKIDRVLDLVSKRLFDHGKIRVISTSSSVEIDFDHAVHVRRSYSNIEPPSPPSPALSSTSSTSDILRRLSQRRVRDVLRS